MTHPGALRRINGGFTLLELMVVIGIFAMMAAMAYGGLSAVLKTRTSLEASLDRTAALQKAYWIMRDDFQNGIHRTVLDNDGQVEPALLYTGIDHRVDFTRAGWPNPLDLPRPTLRRLGYFYDPDKKQLIRRTWPALDRAPRTKPDDTVLLDKVDDIKWRFLDKTGQWQDHWPTTTASGTTPLISASGSTTAQSLPPPTAVELTIKTGDLGTLTWLFAYGLPELTKSNSGSTIAP